jgi:hypothetical protein
MALRAALEAPINKRVGERIGARDDGHGASPAAPRGGSGALRGARGVARFREPPASNWPRSRKFGPLSAERPQAPPRHIRGRILAYPAASGWGEQGLQRRARRKRPGMRLIRLRREDRGRTARRPRRPFPARRAVAELERSFGALARLTRVHWIFATAEICKGLAIVTIGDMVIADDLGELVTIAAQSLRFMDAARGGLRRP